MSVEVQTFTAEMINPRRIRSAPVEGESTMIRFDLKPAVQVSDALAIGSVFTQGVGGAITRKRSWYDNALSILSWALNETGLATCRIDGERLIIEPFPGREMVPMVPARPKASSGAFAEVRVDFEPPLLLVARNVGYIVCPEGGVRNFKFEGSSLAYDLAVEFTRRINEESGGRLKAHFNPVHRNVEVTAPEDVAESEIHVDPPLEDDDEDDLLGVRALWSALINNGRRGQLVINSSTAEAANRLIDWGLAASVGVNKLGRSALGNELIAMVQASCSFDESRCICHSINGAWSCSPKCPHCHPEDL